jgi:flavin-dependent dehydrogenase
MILPADICVVGDGPAGSLTALCLAGFGYRVVLVGDRGSPARLECLPPSIWPALSALPAAGGQRPGSVPPGVLPPGALPSGVLPSGVLPSGVLAPDALSVRARIEAAQFAKCSLVQLRWALPRIEPRADPGGLLVQRGRLDSILLEAAREAGVTLALPHRVPRPDWDGAAWCVGNLRARFLVDAAGRRGVPPRRRRRLSPPLVALGGQWSGPADAPAEMRVAGLQDGWFWAATDGHGVWEVSVFVDAAACAGLRRAGRTALYHAMLAGHPLLTDLLPVAGAPAEGTPAAGKPIEGMAAAGAVLICDASAWLSEDLATDRAIKVGDAAFARDPLSSQGLRAAVRAAPQAAATVHAILSGNDAGAAITRYAGALRDSAQHHVLAAARFYAAGGWRDSAFWRQRSDPVGWPGRTVNDAGFGDAGF